MIEINIWMFNNRNFVNEKYYYVVEITGCIRRTDSKQKI